MSCARKSTTRASEEAKYCKLIERDCYLKCNGWCMIWKEEEGKKKIIRRYSGQNHINFKEM